MTPRDLVVTPKGLRFGGRVFPCSIGKTGVTGTKREGDRATPRGIHRVVGMLFRPDRVAPPNGWARPIGPRDLWSDDMADPQYNHQVRAPHSFSHECLRRSDPLYDLVILTDWNWPCAVAGRGSAIFMHQWRRPRVPTEGCVALRRDHLHRIARQIGKGTRLIVM